MKNTFCSHCGATTKSEIPQGDNRARQVCTACGTIQYENPKLLVGCIIEQGEHILLCRRNIQPRKGKWTVPAGFLENNETAAQGAIRETCEESGADVEILSIYRLFDLPAISQLYLLFRARLLSCPFEPTAESSEIRLFRQEEIPWQDIAFPVITHALRHYCGDADKGVFPFENHHIDVERL